MIARRVVTAIWTTLAAVYIAAAGLGIIGGVAGPQPTFQIDHSSGEPVAVDVRVLKESWFAGLRDGDVILSVNSMDAALIDWVDVDPTTATFTARSQITGAMIAGPVGYDGPATVSATIALQSVALIFALISLFVFARAHRTREIVVFSWFALAAAAALAIVPAHMNAFGPTAGISSGSFIATPVLFLAFFYVLGRAGGPSLGRPVWALMMIGSALIALRLLTVYVFPEYEPALRPMPLMIMLLGVGGGVILLAYRYRRSSDAVVREQLRIVTLGTALGVTPFLWLSILPLAISGQAFLRPETAVLAVMLIPLAFGYAILRHELMGLRRLVHRGVAYALISMVIVVLYGTGLAIVHSFTPAESDAVGSFELLLLLMLFIGVPLLAGARRSALAIVDRVLYRYTVDHHEVVRNLTLTAGSVNDIPGLAEGILKDVSGALDLEFAAYVERAEGGPSVVASVGPVPDTTASIAADAVPQTAPAGVTRLVEIPAAGGGVLFGNVPGLGRRPGVLCLGPKLSGEGFDAEDSRMFQTICGLVSTAVARLELLEDLQAKGTELTEMNTRLLDAEENERAEISAFLHDEPLQKVAYALAQYRQRALPEDLALLLEEVARDLRNTSASLSPDLLRDLGLVPALEWLIHETDGRGPFRIYFSSEGFDRARTLPFDAGLAAYRTVQEALTNCRKHSQARAVWISVRHVADDLLLTIEDNGIGMPAAMGAPGADPASGLGLKAMRQRLTRLGGELTITRRRPRGACVDARIPTGQQPAIAARTVLEELAD